MQKIITKKKFLEIFQKEEYRKKLDKIILNFFGLDTNERITEEELEKEEVTIEIVFMINTEKVLNIFVKDKKLILNHSKKFYLNLSFREVEKHYELLIPCYWEIYIPYCYQELNNKKILLLFAALFYCETPKKVKSILKKIKIFTKEEIEKILTIIKK